jgi:hypothetical protein
LCRIHSSASATAWRSASLRVTHAESDGKPADHVQGRLGATGFVAPKLDNMSADAVGERLLSEIPLPA